MDEQLNIAMQYDGTFDLRFLLDDERVSIDDPVTRSVQIKRGETVLARLDVGDWLIRTPSGRLIKRSELP